MVRLFLLIATIHLISQIHAQHDDPQQFCEAVTDPHVKTWHIQESYNHAYHYQDCYTAGTFPVVRNDFVYFQVKTSKKWMVELTVMFYDGISLSPVCTLFSKNFEIHGDADSRCAAHTITWNTTNNDGHYIMTISYAKARYSTVIEHNSNYQSPRHYNIYTWLPASLARDSTGLCTKSDEDCQLTHRTSEADLEDDNIQHSGRSITQSQAETVCQTYVDAYMKKIRRAPHQRSTSMNNSITSVLAGCEADLIFTGVHEAAQSSMSALMIEEATKDAVSFDSIHTAIQSNIPQALVELNQAVEEAQAEVAEILGLTTTIIETTTIPTTTTEAITTSPVPLASYKCAIYQDMYIQTWHPTNQASPPTRSCLGSTGNYDLVKNKLVRFTLRTTGSVIEELTLRLMDDQSSNVICTVTIAGEQADWMDCEQNGINPSFITTATHETLTVYYGKANFTTIVTRDIGINVGRFNINVYLNPESAVQSSGICHLATSCTGNASAQTRKRFRRGSN